MQIRVGKGNFYRGFWLQVFSNNSCNILNFKKYIFFRYMFSYLSLMSATLFSQSITWLRKGFSWAVTLAKLRCWFRKKICVCEVLCGVLLSSFPLTVIILKIRGTTVKIISASMWILQPFFCFLDISCLGRTSYHF